MKISSIDIGYSNLKEYHGHITDEGVLVIDKVIKKPAGASPVEFLPRKMNKGTLSEDQDETFVYIKKVKWVTGVEPHRIREWSRELHAQYTSTDSYKALFYSTLLDSGNDCIDILVTGSEVQRYEKLL